jgi:hypothetical protein
MTGHEPARGGPVAEGFDDQVAALRAGVERLSLLFEEHLDEWEPELLRALVSPRWTPLLRERFDQLRVMAARCRELGEAMMAAAAQHDGDIQHVHDSPQDTTPASSRGEMGDPEF